MPHLRGKVRRQQLPSGQDGQVLVLDAHSANGIAWRSGVDRLITDITPELSGDLDCNNFKVTGLGTPTAGTDAANKTYADGVVFPDAYYCGSKSLGSGATTVTINAVTWATKPGTWTANVSSLWAESGTSGNIVYTGTATRKFFVSYSLTLDFIAAGSLYASGTSITGKIEKIPSGGSVGDVAGSIGESIRSFYLTAFGQYYYLCHVSRGTIVSVAENDSLNFRYGFGNRNNASGTYTATLKQTGDTNYTGTVKGVTLNIVPVDAAA